MRQVSGRGSDDSRGLPPLHSLFISGSDGSDRTFGLMPTGEEAFVRVHVFGVAEPHNFEMCPICGATEGLTREHVPQRDLGGTVMTYTCKPCNNRLGAGVEDELRHWFDDAIFDVRFSGSNVPGARKFPRILLRTADDQVGTFFDVDKTDPELAAILSSGDAKISYRIPNPRVWRVAALKHAYLAACLLLGEVPDTEHAAQVRGVLVTARERGRDELPPETGLANGLRLAKSQQPGQGPTVVLVALVDKEGTALDYGISFAGTLFVSWPLDVDLFWKAVQRLADLESGTPPDHIA